MANRIYPLWKKALMEGGANSDIDFDNVTDGPYCALVDTNFYNYSDAHEFYDALSGIVGTDQRITTPTIAADAVFDGVDLLFPSVSGSGVSALVIYRRNAGASSTWRLVAYYDTAGGLPLLPNGGNIIVLWNALGIFRL